MSRLNHRLCRLEERFDGAECPECGSSPDAPVEDYAVIWHDIEPVGPGEGAS